MKTSKKVIIAAIALIAAAIFNIYYLAAVILVLLHMLFKYITSPKDTLGQKIIFGAFVVCDLALLALMVFRPDIRFLKVFSLPQVLLIVVAFMVLVFPAAKSKVQRFLAQPSAASVKPTGEQDQAGPFTSSFTKATKNLLVNI